MRDIVIIGAGGFAHEVAWLIERINNTKPIWNLIGFIENGFYTTEKYHYPVIGDDSWLADNNEGLCAVCAIASPKKRQRVISKFQNVEFVNLIDPSVIMDKNINIGKGCIICAGTIITVDVEIGDHVIINLDCTIGHNSIIRNFTTIYPSVNISGYVNLYGSNEIGTGAQIIQNLSIGKKSIIGAGAVVTKDIPADCTAVGCPAKPKLMHDEQNE